MCDEDHDISCHNGACVDKGTECQYGMGCRDATHLRNCGNYLKNLGNIVIDSFVNHF